MVSVWIANRVILIQFQRRWVYEAYLLRRYDKKTKYSSFSLNDEE